MANSSAKRLIKANAARLARLRLIIALSTVIYLISRFLRRPLFDLFHFIAFPLILIFQLLPYYFLYSAARPRYFDDGQLQYGGEDIAQAGVLEYAHDLIYVAVAVQLGVSVSRWAALLSLVVPSYALYAMCAGRGGDDDDDLHGGGAADAAARMAGMSRKERRKADREARKAR